MKDKDLKSNKKIFYEIKIHHLKTELNIVRLRDVLLKGQQKVLKMEIRDKLMSHEDIQALFDYYSLIEDFQLMIIRQWVSDHWMPYATAVRDQGVVKVNTRTKTSFIDGMA